MSSFEYIFGMKICQMNSCTLNFRTKDRYICTVLLIFIESMIRNRISLNHLDSYEFFCGVIGIRCLIFFGLLFLQLNRSDSDSAMSNFKKGPFQRNSLDRRSMRWKRVSQLFAHYGKSFYVQEEIDL